MKQKKVDFSFMVEFVTVVVVSLASLMVGMRDLMMASNDVYPITSDAMGHLAKVAYIAECLQQWKLPSWFPFWYNGSTVSQYYPPLSYILMAPIQVATGNVMLTYKIFCFLSIFIGALGVWFCCRKFMGNWCGVFGAAVYCVEPFLLRSLTLAGVLAQGPVFMISPWFLYSVLRYVLNPKRSLWIANAVFTALLILSHAMHAYMMCLCITIILVICAIFRKIDGKKVTMLGLAIAVGGVSTAVWAVQGATRLENPAIPYLLEEAALIYTATLDWYNGVNERSGGLYFHGILFISCAAAALIYTVLNLKKKNRCIHGNVYIGYTILLFLFTVVFSFGKHLPFFGVVPLARSLVPGRILSLTAVCAAVLCAYIVYTVSRIGRYKEIRALMGLIVASAIMLGVNPLGNHSYTRDLNEMYKGIMTKIGGEGGPFDKGRYSWLASVFSWESYFPVIHNFNTTDGWNIEGTPHNSAIWLHNIALVANREDYVIKNLLHWNVRSLLVDKNYEKLLRKLKEEQGFYEVDGYERFSILKSDSPSSYYFEDRRDTAVAGLGGDGMAITFPWVVRGTRQKLSLADIQELRRYKTIYFSQPDMDTRYDVEKFEALVRQLVKEGKTVIVEAGSDQNFPVLGVSSYDVEVDGDTVLHRNENAQFSCAVKSLEFNEAHTSRAYIGLDLAYYILDKKNSTLSSDIIGEKYIEEGKVYFVGMMLSQNLEASYIQRVGYVPEIQGDRGVLPQKEILEAILEIGSPEKEFKPESFPVLRQQWEYNGGEFEYVSDREAEITVSVTYTPHWKITLDGERIPAQSKENLISLRLPSGRHTVKLHYGMTRYGIIGLVITCMGLFMGILIGIGYKRFESRIDQLIGRLGKTLEVE